LRKEESLLEEIFLFTYYLPGIPYGDLLGMTSKERVWFLKRLAKEIKERPRMSSLF
jgi:hypothetical protein